MTWLALLLRNPWRTLAIALAAWLALSLWQLRGARADAAVHKAELATVSGLVQSAADSALKLSDQLDNCQRDLFRTRHNVAEALDARAKAQAESDRRVSAMRRATREDYDRHPELAHCRVPDAVSRRLQQAAVGQG